MNKVIELKLIAREMRKMGLEEKDTPRYAELTAQASRLTAELRQN